MLANAMLIQQALTLVKDRAPLIGEISTTFSAKACTKGSTVSAYVYGKPTLSDVGAAATPASATSYPVVLNKHKQLKWAISYEQMSCTDVDIVKGVAGDMADAIADAITAAAMEQFTAEKFSHSTACTRGAIDRKVINQARAELVKRKCSKSRFGVVSPDVYAELLNDRSLSNANNPLGAAVVRDGVLQNAAGFNIYENPEMPSGLDGVFAGKESVLFAMGAPVDPSRGGVIAGAGNFEVFTDAATGLTILAQECVNKDLSVELTFIFLYGMEAGVKSAAQRLVVNEPEVA